MQKIIVALLVLGLAMSAQYVPVQNVYDGITIGNKKAPFHLEAIYDLDCPSSKASNTILNEVFLQLDFNNQNSFFFTQHLLPLPYHYTAFFASKVSHYINATYGSQAAYYFNNKYFASQEIFNNSNTQNKSNQNIYINLASFTAQVMPQFNINESDVLAALNNSTFESQTRASFKFATSRGTSGTPTFWANGVVINGASSFNKTQWLQFIQQYTNLTAVQEPILDQQAFLQ